jgi:ligand-binding sensor domain-containing protein
MFEGLKSLLLRCNLAALLLGLLACHDLHAQQLAFRRVNTANGLKDNLVFDAVEDQNGLVWIATAAGLHTYDGYKVREWNEITDQWLQTREVRDLWADPSGNIWMLGANDRMLWFDSFRRPQLLSYANPKDSGNIRFIFPQNSTGHLYLLVDKKMMRVKKGSTIIEKMADLPDSLMRRNYFQETEAGPDEYFITGSDRVVLLSLSTGKVKRSWQVPRAMCTYFMSNGHLLVSTENNRQLFEIDPQSGSIMNNLGSLTDQFGKPVNGYLRYMARLADGRFAVTSGYGGLYIVDPIAKKLWNYAHDPLNEVSVSGNNTFKVRSTPDGLIFVTTRSSGLNIVNLNQPQAYSIKRFKDSITHRIFDGFVSPMAQDQQGKIWLGSQGGLFRWNGITNDVQFSDYGVIDGESIAGKEEVRALYCQPKGDLWVGLNRYGIVVLDKAGKPVRYFNRQQKDSTLKLPSNFISQISAVPGDNLLWISTTGGLCFANPATMRIVKHPSQTLLDSLHRKNILQIWAKSANEIWIVTNRGAWQYLPLIGKLKSLTKKEGLHNNVIYGVSGDSLGNIYLAGAAGLDVVQPNGKIKFYNRHNGLPEDYCRSVVTDKQGRVWVGNTNFLVAIDPNTGILRSFDASYGFTGNGFRLSSAYTMQDGSLLFGCNEGISVFDPEQMWQSAQPVTVRIESLRANDSTWHFTSDANIGLSAEKNSLVFQLQIIALNGLKTVRLQYRLTGFDTSWRDVGEGLILQTNPLSPGAYQLDVRYHTGDNQWRASANKVLFTIDRVWFKSPWVIGLVVFVFLAFAWLLGRMWLAQRKLRREEAETEKLILQLSQILHEQQDVESMLWHLARNCISRMQLEDCVIYLLDRERNVLFQQAAWGPKMGETDSINEPIEIPVGKGIVGHAAAHAQPVLVTDTRLDARYLVDDQQRLSELAVPILADGKVLGVIDSEHSRKGFFTNKHVAILTTIASVLGSKLASMQAAEEKNSAEFELLENKQRLSEVEMKALRAQMNPHFLFNSLNSINNFILKNDAENASAYLTRFARLVRLILDNSRHEWVSLEHELQALKLYIELEQLRFDQTFDYKMQTELGIDVMHCQIPPMMLQPYVENAIWHGLLHRNSEGGMLQINLAMSGKDHLKITIEDNGVGRKASALHKSQQRSMHKQSHGMQITSERLDTINAVYQIDARSSIEDLYDEAGHASGTRVVLTMKYRSYENDHY